MLSTNDVNHSDDSDSSSGSSSSSSSSDDERKDDLTRAMEEIYSSLSRVEDNGRRMVELFEYLPDRQTYVDYYVVIKKPIAMTQILEKMRNGSYSDFALFIADFTTMFDNAKTYNREDCLAYKDATSLSKEFRRLIFEKMTQYPSLVPESGPLREVYNALLKSGAATKPPAVPSSTAAASSSTSSKAANSVTPVATKPPKVYNCPHCDYNSTRRADVTRHKKKKHPELIPESSKATNRRGWTPSPYPGAAQRVLDELEDRRPLHYREITDVAIEKGFINPQGKTPANTMHGQLNKSALFYSAGKGFFGLASWKDEAGNVPLATGTGPPVVVKKRVRAPKGSALKRVKVAPSSTGGDGADEQQIFNRAPLNTQTAYGSMLGEEETSDEDSEGEYGINSLMSRRPAKPPPSRPAAPKPPTANIPVATIVQPSTTQQVVGDVSMERAPDASENGDGTAQTGNTGENGNIEVASTAREHPNNENPEEDEEDDDDEDDDDDDEEEDSDEDSEEESAKKERMLPLSTLHRTLNYGVAFASYGRQHTSMPWLRSLVAGARPSS